MNLLLVHALWAADLAAVGCWRSCNFMYPNIIFSEPWGGRRGRLKGKLESYIIVEFLLVYNFSYCTVHSIRCTFPYCIVPQLYSTLTTLTVQYPYYIIPIQLLTLGMMVSGMAWSNDGSLNRASRTKAKNGLDLRLETTDWVANHSIWRSRLGGARTSINPIHSTYNNVEDCWDRSIHTSPSHKSPSLPESLD